MARITQQEFSRRHGSKPVERINYSALTTERSPDSWIRVAELARTPRNPSGLLPFSPATLWRKVKNNTFPAPTRLSEGVTAWRWADIQSWLDQQTGAQS